ncbi:TRAP transporter small permease [Chloroflexota bacterium]
MRVKESLRKSVYLLVRVFDWTTRWSANIGSFLLLLICLIVVYDVTMRYFFLRPTFWAQDIVEYILVYSTFFAAAWLLRRERHVHLPILIDRLRPKAQVVMNLVTSIIGTVVCVILLWQSFARMWDLLQAGIRVPHTLAVPEWIVTAAIPFGSLLLSIGFMRRACSFFATLRIMSSNKH